MDQLRIYNTKSRQIELFKPQTEGSVTLYTCGPTVYNSLHIGNWLAYIRWDTLVRTLQINSYKVNRVINITDVGHLVGDGDDGEDKLEAGAKREGSDAWQIAERYTIEFKEGMAELNLLPPSKYAKATDYINEQIELIKILESKGVTYKINDGIYFDTSKFETYANFARLDLSHQEAGARVESNPQKIQPWDFALWKFSPGDKKRDMEWDSPWGIGFPGWHIECSAIALKLLGETLDIHTGGIDHIQVHHTNEIAQSETATGKTFANYWLHNNFLLINDSKISKSLDNGFNLKDIQEKGFSSLDYKMMVLQSHYRSEANFSWEVLEAAKIRHKQLRNFAVLRYQTSPQSSNLESGYFKNKKTEIIKHLNNDLSTPLVLSVLSETIDQVMSKIFSSISNDDQKAFDEFIQFLDLALGFKLFELPDIKEQQKNLIYKRQQARNNQDWSTADSLRDELIGQGIEIKDLPKTQVWNWL